MSRHYVGTSGFASPSVRALQDKRPGAGRTHRELLEDYALCLRAVEMDSAFYRFPSTETVRQWAEVVPDDFACTVRMSRSATHSRAVLDPSPVPGCLRALNPLGSRLGCILFTTSPTMGCDVDRVAAVLSALPDGVRTAWEFRDPSWMCPEVLDLLVEHNAAPVVVETTDTTVCGEVLPGGTLGEKWQFPFVYVRFRREHYHVADILDWAETLGEARMRGADVFAFFRQSPEALSYAVALDEVLSDLA